MKTRKGTENINFGRKTPFDIELNSQIWRFDYFDVVNIKMAALPLTTNELQRDDCFDI